MHYERVHVPPQPEFYEPGMQLSEILERYDSFVRDISTGHQELLQFVASRHAYAFEQESRHPAGYSIDGTLQQTYDGVNAVTGNTELLTELLLGTTASNVISNMDDEHKALTSLIHRAAATGGFQNPQIISLMSMSHDPEQQYAMRVALNKRVFAQARADANIYGKSDPRVSEVLQHASSVNVQKLMVAALDTSVLDAAVLHVSNAGGLQSDDLRHILESSSSETAKLAIASALDHAVLLHAVGTQNIGANDTIPLESILSAASSEYVRDVFTSRVHDPHYMRAFDFDAHKKFYKNYNPYDENHAVDAQTRSFIDDKFGPDSTFWHPASRREKARQEEPPRRQKQQHDPPRTERPPKPAVDPYIEVNELVKRAILRNRNFGWLESESPQNILRVVNSVRSMRLAAEDKGSAMPDIKVYRKYQIQIEIARSAGDMQKVARLEASARILDALMGGPRGTLPF